MNKLAPLPGPQTKALADVESRELLYGGARGGGKTFVGIIWMLIPAANGSNVKEYRGLVIRRNYIDLCDWIDRAMRVYSAFGAKLSGGNIHFPAGGVIRTGHLADAGAYEKYQGHEYHRILVEELTQIPAEVDYLKLISSCRSTIPGLSARVFATANPGGPGHSWVKTRFRCHLKDCKPFQDEQGQVRLFIPAKLSDNPYLDKTDYRKTLESLPEQLRRAWLDGDWDTLSGQFFPEFSRSAHVIEPIHIKGHWKRYAALDWGYRPDPWACLWFAVDEFGTEYLYREAHGNEMTPEQVAERLKMLSADDDNFILRVADPSMWANKDGVSSAERMIMAGWHIVPGHNDRANGAMRIREVLKGNSNGSALKIFNTCIKTIEALESMVHDEKDPLKYADHPLDHWVDPLRYHLMARPSRSQPEPRKPDWNTLEVLQNRAFMAQGGY
jgi:phage terminase large subunit